MQMSALRYSVFVNGENYGGGNPRVDRSPILTRYVHEQLAAELALSRRLWCFPQARR